MARLAAELIDTIEMPGLEILSLLYKLKLKKTDIAIVFDNPSFLAHWSEDVVAPKNSFQLTFNAAVTEEWMRRLADLKVTSYTRPLR